MSDRRLTAGDIRQLPEKSVKARRRALRALDLMRDRGISLTEAVDRANTSRRTMLKYAGRGLEKNESGEWDPKPWDRIVRLMDLPRPGGQERIPIQDSRTASKVGRYKTAVKKFARTDDDSALEEFENVTFQVNGETEGFLTDRDTLKRLGFAGELSNENIYADL